jgi:hypothetical protein
MQSFLKTDYVPLQRKVPRLQNYALLYCAGSYFGVEEGN